MALDTNGDNNGSTLLRVEGLKTYFFQRNAVLKAVDGVSFRPWAELVLGHEKLMHYSLLAGEQALSAYSWQEALDHFQRALDAKERHPMDAGVAVTLSVPSWRMGRVPTTLNS